jgi:hypothetical protein
MGIKIAFSGLLALDHSGPKCFINRTKLKGCFKDLSSYHIVIDLPATTKGWLNQGLLGQRWTGL